jgi:hypothetical protein
VDPITGKLLEVAAKAAGKELVKFIGPLVGLVDAQQKVLQEIQRDTKALVEAPLEEARNYVRDARDAETEENQQKFLLKAEDAFVRAASLQTDPLNKAYAWTGSAIIKAHFQPGERLIIKQHFDNAYRAAVAAGEQAADPAPKESPAWLARPSRAAFWVAKWLITPSFVRSEFTFGRRPRSIRMSTAQSLRVPGLGGFQTETYSATPPARDRESRLLEIASYVCELREILTSYGVTASDVPPYRVRLEPGPHMSYGARQVGAERSDLLGIGL